MIVGALLNVFNNYIAPVLSNIATLVSEVLNGPVSDAIGQALILIGKVIDILGILWESILAPFISWLIETIIPVLTPIFEWVATTFINLFGTVSQITAGILEVLNGFLDFFKGVFTGDITLVTEGLKTIAEAIWSMLSKLGKKSDIHTHPHKFRRTLLTDAGSRGIPLQEIQAYAGHKKPDTTMMYVTVNEDNVKASFRRYIA